MEVNFAVASILFVHCFVNSIQGMDENERFSVTICSSNKMKKILLQWHHIIQHLTDLHIICNFETRPTNKQYCNYYIQYYGIFNSVYSLTQEIEQVISFNILSFILVRYICSRKEESSKMNSIKMASFKLGISKSLLIHYFPLHIKSAINIKNILIY